MIIENPVPIFQQWIGVATVYWLFAVAVLALAACIGGIGFLLLRREPSQVLPLFISGLKNGIDDLVSISWRRVSAVARLIIHESVRKKVLVVALIFLILLMFAGWFLDPESPDPARLYLSFVLSTTTYLVLLLALFLSSLSLPADFKNKTIYTIVTKPVRSSEIVLGRILGLAAIGTVILLMMAVMSYFFVSMSLSHTHIVIENEDLFPIAGVNADSKDPSVKVAEGMTRLANWHKHEIEEYADGSFIVKQVNNHTHSIKKVTEGDRTRYIVGRERGTVQAKVPVYGKIKFRDAGEYEKSAGINVGEEWDYRTYVAGATNEAVIWTFDHISPKYINREGKIPVETTISVYRSHKGEIEQTIMGALLVRNPSTGLTAQAEVFNSEKYVTKELLIPQAFSKADVEKAPRVLKIYNDETTLASSYEIDPQKETYDLFEDFVVNGRLEVWLQCLDSGQYFGAAEPDLYIRSKDANVFFNFIKAYFGIWQEMVILISFGVLFSTFLSGPVAMVSTFGILIASFCKNLFSLVAMGHSLGGGPFEAFNRLITHENLMSDLPNTFATSLLKFFDTIARGFLMFIGLAIPSFSDYNIYMDSVASGFDISWNTICVHAVKTFAYILPLFVVGYLILRNREVAK